MATATKFIQILRNFLAGRNLQEKLQHRYVEELSKRTQPPPNLPVGPKHKFADNYYFTRDCRRLSTPPTVILHSQKAITAGSQVAEKSNVPVTPGPAYHGPPLSTDEPYL